MLVAGIAILASLESVEDLFCIMYNVEATVKVHLFTYTYDLAELIADYSTTLPQFTQ